MSRRFPPGVKQRPADLLACLQRLRFLGGEEKRNASATSARAIRPRVVRRRLNRGILMIAARHRLQHVDGQSMTRSRQCWILLTQKPIRTSRRWLINPEGDCCGRTHSRHCLMPLHRLPLSSERSTRLVITRQTKSGTERSAKLESPVRVRELSFARVRVIAHPSAGNRSFAVGVKPRTFTICHFTFVICH